MRKAARGALAAVQQCYRLLLLLCPVAAPLLCCHLLQLGSQPHPLLQQEQQRQDSGLRPVAILHPSLLLVAWLRWLASQLLGASLQHLA